MLMIVAHLGLIAACLGLGLWCRKLTRSAVALEQESRGLVAAASAIPAPVRDAVAGDGSRRISIEILNPMQLAARESWFAQTFGSLAAPLIHRMVYQKALPMVISEMQKHGVEARVEITRPPADGRG